MISDATLIVLKYTGGFIAAAYGVYATLTDFRIEKKDGSKVLTAKGYVGIALLVVSSVLALSVDGLKDYREHQQQIKDQEAKLAAAEAEADRVRRARANEEKIINQLRTQSADLKTTLGVLRTNTIASTAMSTTLSTQLGVTTNISTKLGATAESLAATSQTTNAILDENVSRIDALTVEVSMTVDLRALNKETGNQALSLATRQLLENWHNRAARSDERQVERTILIELQRRVTAVRSVIFAGWTLFVWLDKSNVRDEPDRYFEMVLDNENGISNFVIERLIDMNVYDDSGDINPRLEVRARYTLAPDRSTGFRQFKDLNGALWAVTLRTNPDILRVEQIDLYAGPGTFVFYKDKFLTLASSDNAVATSKPGRLTSATHGEYYGELVIPAKYF